MALTRTGGFGFKWRRAAHTLTAPATLDRRHIYILPTRYGWFFALLLVIMLLGAINYTLSLGFALVFLLASMASIALLHTWRNLAHLRLTLGKATPVFAGDDAVFELLLSQRDRRPRYAIALCFDGAAPHHVDIPPRGQVNVRLTLPSRRRGWLRARRIRLETQFPLSLFYAWAYVEPDRRCLVYPRPADDALPLAALPGQDASGRADSASGDDDFSGHRDWRIGDSPQRVDWKASARARSLLTKTFSSTIQQPLWLDWAATPGADDEARIRQLARWIVDAERAQNFYGLRLPGRTFAPDHGAQHRHQCLQALALM